MCIRDRRETERERERERETERDRERQRETERETETDRQTDRQRQRYRERERHRDRDREYFINAVCLLVLRRQYICNTQLRTQIISGISVITAYVAYASAN